MSCSPNLTLCEKDYKKKPTRLPNTILSMNVKRKTIPNFELNSEQYTYVFLLLVVFTVLSISK